MSSLGKSGRVKRVALFPPLLLLISGSPLGASPPESEPRNPGLLNVHLRHAPAFEARFVEMSTHVSLQINYSPRDGLTPRDFLNDLNEECRKQVYREAKRIYGRKQVYAPPTFSGDENPYTYAMVYPRRRGSYSDRTPYSDELLAGFHDPGESPPWTINPWGPTNHDLGNPAAYQDPPAQETADLARNITPPAVRSPFSYESRGDSKSLPQDPILVSYWVTDIQTTNMPHDPGRNGSIWARGCQAWVLVPKPWIHQHSGGRECSLGIKARYTESTLRELVTQTRAQAYAHDMISVLAVLARTAVTHIEHRSEQLVGLLNEQVDELYPDGATVPGRISELLDGLIDGNQDVRAELLSEIDAILARSEEDLARYGDWVDEMLGYLANDPRRGSDYKDERQDLVGAKVTP